MKGLLFRAGLAIGLVAVLAGAFLLRSHTGLDDSRNCYEIAQSATVLVTSAESGSGSGVVVNRNNKLFVWTAAHVVDASDSVTIKSFIRHNDRRVGEIIFTARVLARNNSLDVALLWLIAPTNYFDAVQFIEPAEQLRVGQSVFHCGNFWGADFDDSVSVGVISQLGVRPDNSAWPWPGQMHQTTTFVTYGSSGGAIFRHLDGRVIGILVGGVAPGVSDVNLFVPVPEIARWAEREKLTWAIYGTQSPPDSLLEADAANAERQRKLVTPYP